MIEHTCKFCNEKLISDKPSQIGAHVRNCKSNPNRDISYIEFGIARDKKLKEKSEKCRLNYENSPKQCKNCNKLISYENRTNLFCNHSCSATFNNKKRGARTKKTKLKISKTNKGKESKRKGKKYGKHKVKRKPVEKIRIKWKCPICEIVLELVPFKTKNKKYCSGTCRNKINNKLINGSRSKAEKYLEEILTKEFPNLEILFNNRKILNGNKELDVYIPSLNLAIEWNGIYHYKNYRGDEFLKITQNKDLIKLNECKEKNIELYIVKDLKSSNKFIREETNKIVNYIKNKNGSTQ